jgi:BirA family biotin operon repressor/biotin-[acetyl-CoA-carboxylase] ligase
MINADQLAEEMLVSLLAEAPEEYLGADAICGKLGLPRAVVFRQIDQLRSKGYRIDARPISGYRLLEVPDRITSLELSPLLVTEELGRTVHFFEELTSTNDRARELAEDGASQGELVIAETQLQGRGRRGRGWFSTPGKNLTFSLVLRPRLSSARASELTLAAGVALCELLREAAFDARLKWPNDVWIADRKVAGILTEAASDQGGLRYAVLGIGINVNVVEFPPELEAIAGSLRLARGEPLPRAFLLAAVLERLELWLGRLETDGLGQVLQRCRGWSATLGRRVVVEATPPIEGTAEAIDDSGALLVRDPAGRLQRVTAGEVGLAG